ncbi:M48 family metallopeptidase [Zoogloea sp.]|uniref:M48 family metallopeptidase n=1 Tax=Zoogloea sp. TaxID=49181 RepID=UPI002620AF38|nr:M48 family metallopeptidase [Zoogloea sp.]MDD3355261.1 M48 family metallopeptidase [Zoogloea sp.]
MSTHGPLPARHYPAGGDAHGRAVHLTWEGGALTLLSADQPPLRIPPEGLRAEARGFNHGQWALQWPGEDGGEHLLLIDDRLVGPLREVAPHLFHQGDRSRHRQKRRFGLGITLLILLPLLLVAALFLALDPLADRVVARIPPSVEAQIGRAVLTQTRLQSRMIDAGPAHDTVQAIARRLVRPGEKLEFHLADEPEINAFAAPGGVVIVYKGLLDKADTPEEVAGVLAHEIAHVELRHSLHQIVRSAGLRVIVAALAGNYGDLGSWAARLGELTFSREAEREADQRAIERLAEARIDPGGLLRFFERLEKMERAQGARLPALLSTHPDTPERIRALRKSLAAHPQSPAEPIAVDWQRSPGGR